MGDNFKYDDYKVQCDISGFWDKASNMRMRWDGFFVRKDFWEPRHPQDFVRGKKDDQNVEIARPDNYVEDLDTNPVTQDDL